MVCPGRALPETNTANSIRGVDRQARGSDATFLCVIDGSGFVSGSDGVEVPIEAFQAAFWEAGEMHETRTDIGMITITLEGTDLQPFAPR